MTYLNNIPLLTILGIVLVSGYYFGGIARKIRLPSLIGFMVLGVLTGVSADKFFGIKILHAERLKQLEFITDIVLGFVAISIGLELKLSTLKRLGVGIMAIILGESFFAFIFVTVIIYAVFRDWPMALIFGAMAPASAPAGTIAVIKEYRAKGELTNALYAVVGIDDGLAIIIFGFANAIAKGMLSAENGGGKLSLAAGLWYPSREILFSIVLGIVLGFLLCQLVRHLKLTHDFLIMVLGAVLIGVDLANEYHLSLIITNMTMGFILVNTRRDETLMKVNGVIMDVIPMMFILFFVLAGAHLRLDILPKLGLLGLLYIIGRSAGLLSAPPLFARIFGMPEKIRKYLGMGILSQAGVAIGLSLIVQQEFMEIGTDHALQIGAAVITTVTATSIFFEIIGPILTKIGLRKAGEIPE